MQDWFRRLKTAAAWRLRCFWAVLGARRRSLAVLSASPLARLLVVCHGNIYRSAYAGALLDARLADLSRVRSAGLYPRAGRPSPPDLVAIGSKAHVDLTAHRSSVVSAADLAWADTIVLMDRHNWQALCQLGADPRKMIWLGCLGGRAEIPDPFGMPVNQAALVIQRVHRCAEALASAIAARRNSAANKPLTQFQ